MAVHEGDRLVGRETEVGALLATVRDVVRGRGGVVLVRGEPGIGKSALVRAGLAEARASGCRVFQASANPLTARFPLQVLREAIGLRAADAAPPSDLAAPLTVQAEEVISWLDRLCVTVPTVVAIEDLQWADEATLQVWSRLIVDCEQMALLLVATARPVPHRAEITQLCRVMSTRQGLVLDLDPLDDEETAALAGQMAGAPAGTELQSVLSAAGGNPLYVREIVEALMRSSEMEVIAGRAELRVPRSAGTVSLGGAIADRLDFVAPATREVLRHASLLGADIRVTDLAVVTGRSPSDLVAPIEESLTAGILASEAERLTFRHGLIRDSLYESMPVALRAALHQQAAKALATAESPPDRVVAQLLESSGDADSWTIEWLLEHGPLLAVRSSVATQELLARILVNQLPVESRREDLDEILAIAAFHNHDHDLLGRLSRRLLARTTDARRAATIAWMLGDDLLRMGRFDEALTVAAAFPSPAPTNIKVLRGMALQHLGRYDEARAEASAALSAARIERDQVMAARALHVLSIAAWVDSDANQAVALIDEALDEVGGEPSAVSLRVLLWVNRANWSPTADQVEKALHGARKLTGLGDGTQDVSVASAEATYYYRCGRWDDALAVTGSEVMVSDGSASRKVRRHGIAALIAARRGQTTTTEQHLAAVEGLPVTGMVRAQSLWLLLARATVADRAGDRAAALDLLRPTISPDEADLHPGRWQWLPTMIRLAQAVGDTMLIEDVLSVAADDAADPSTADKRAAAVWCAALVSGDGDELDGCVEHFRTAGWLPLVAELCMDSAAARAAAGDLIGARSRLNEAAELCTDLGATWELSRADARLRTFGVRRGRSSRPDRATSGWGALTATELRVADLVAKGLSNPDIAGQLFISRRTVQTHVAHILDKLDVRSRVDVAIIAERQQ